MPRIALIPGDGIGREVTRQARKVLEAVGPGLELEIDEWDLGADRYLETGTTITDDEFDRLARDYDALLLGALGDPRVPGNEHARDILLGLRFRLDLYVNLRPIRLIGGQSSPLRDVRPQDLDMVIFRENTEGLYTGMGGVFKEGTPDEVAIEEDVNTRKGVERILRAAFEHARQTGRRVTLAHGGRQVDRHGRQLGHLIRDDGLWVQGAMLEQGMARVYSFRDNRAAVAEMLAIERRARAARRGIWAHPFYAVRSPQGTFGSLDSFQLVEGIVAATAEVRRRVYLNFGENWRDDFTVSIAPGDAALFERAGMDLLALEGRRIRVRGWLYAFNGPMIDATHPEQIEVLEDE